MVEDFNALTARLLDKLDESKERQKAYEAGHATAEEACEARRRASEFQRSTIETQRSLLRGDYPRRD